MTTPKFTKSELTALKKASAKIAEAIEIARDIHSQVSERKDDARSAWEDRSEKWQESDKGQEASQAIDDFEEHVETIEQFVDSAEDSASDLDGLITECEG